MRTPLPKITLAIALGLVVPLGAYTAFQFAQTNRNEALLRSIYRRELQSILFSINQHSWDVYNSWLTDLGSRLNALETSAGADSSWLKRWLQERPALLAVIVCDSVGHLLVQAGRDPQSAALGSALMAGLRSRRAEIATSLQKARRGYGRPVVFSAGDSLTHSTWLVSPVIRGGQDIVLAAVLLDQWHFANEVVARKLNSIASGDFLFSVRNARTGRLLFETEELEDTRFEHAESLWILPEVEVRVKLRGTTLEEMARNSTRRNLTYLVILNALILLGTGFLLRNVWQEKRLAQMKTDFVANVSHELRTPLSLIRMYAEMLEMGRIRGEEKRQHYYRTIVSESARLTQLINNILDFARLEAGRKQYHFQPVCLNDVVRETVEMFRHHLERQGFQLDLRMAEVLPLIQGDPSALVQALVNLLDNACKFSTSERWVGIVTGVSDGHAFVSVADRGIGIPPAEKERIFEKFYRVGSSLVPETKGSGLGLAIVKHIVEDHRGRIEVQSTPGKGSTFTILFPLIREERTHGAHPNRRG
ncbi:MAG: ATP-binding protein [candidate division KSB1 bacterium]|nr:ATP-binding protein [candidate division KSB1 bacterium]